MLDIQPAKAKINKLLCKAVPVNASGIGSAHRLKYNVHILSWNFGQQFNWLAQWYNLFLNYKSTIMKRKIKAVSKKDSVVIKPDLKWQVGPYKNIFDQQFHLPQPLLFLCKLMDITPRELIIEFIDNICFGSWKREGRDNARAHLVEYFLEQGYGQKYYSAEKIREIFKELDAIGMLYPMDCKPKMQDLHVEWRAKYQKYWFKKWFNKNVRKV